MWDFTLEAFVEKSLRNCASIPGFVYFGTLPLGKSWAFTFAKHRDSGLLEISNFETIHADLLSRFPADVEIVRASHWAVGHIEHLAARLLDEQQQITETASAVYTWVLALRDYPAADPEDLSLREWEAAVDSVEFYIKGRIKQTAPWGWQQEVVNGMDYTEVLDDFSVRFSHDPTEVARRLGFLEVDGDD